MVFMAMPVLAVDEVEDFSVAEHMGCCENESEIVFPIPVFLLDENEELIMEVRGCSSHSSASDCYAMAVTKILGSCVYNERYRCSTCHVTTKLYAGGGKSGGIHGRDCRECYDISCVHGSPY
jgi:hypothetical protein